MRGPYVAPKGTHGEGLTNADALAVLIDVLGGPPLLGALYRVAMWQDAETEEVRFIGEYVGMAEDRMPGYTEPALRFVIRNPVRAADADSGTRAYPFAVWPLDISHLSSAQPGDLEMSMRPPRKQGEAPAPGWPPVR
jgi:hypothetical protein